MSSACSLLKLAEVSSELGTAQPQLVLIFYLTAVISHQRNYQLDLGILDCFLGKLSPIIGNLVFQNKGILDFFLTTVFSHPENYRWI